MINFQDRKSFKISLKVTRNIMKKIWIFDDNGSRSFVYFFVETDNFVLANLNNTE